MWNVERLGYVDSVVERKLRDLCVRQKGEIALDLVWKEGAVAEAIGNVMRSKNDLVSVCIPQSADTALCRRLRVRFKVSKQKPVRRLRFVKDVGAKLVALRVITQAHSLDSYCGTERTGASSRDGKRMAGMLTLRAPAKINLTLEVLGLRDDGFHSIRSVMVPLELADELTIEPSTQFSFTCDRAELGGDGNLAVVAMRALGTLPAIRMELRKRIPVQAGLGGGSSDAAAVLKAAMTGTFGPPVARDWLRIARALGSDVPFFLAGTAALVEGTGERITPAGAIPRWHALIVKPPAAISTAAAYAELDRTQRPRRPRKGSVSILLLEALQRADFSSVEKLMQNDFADLIASHTPAIAAAFNALRAGGATNALLAGSGACVFTLAPERSKIESIVERLDLPENYERFTSAFAATPQWRA